MASRNGSAIAENDRRLIRDHALYVREALFSCVTQAQVECAVAFARYLSLAGLNSENYWLFLRLLMTNNPWVIDEMLHDREPRLLFSTIRPDAELIEAAFQTLFSRHPEELYPRALEALLGIIQNAYFDADDGYRIRRLSIMDINALGKFLLKDEPQEHPQNRLLLEILDRLTRLGDYYGEPDKNVLSKHAFNVRFAYFDRTRELVDAIPEPLLVRVPDRHGVAPEEDYADLVAKRRERKRDKAGRFVREAPAPAPSAAPKGSGEALSAAGSPVAEAGSAGLAETAEANAAPAPATTASKSGTGTESTPKPAAGKGQEGRGAPIGGGAARTSAAAGKSGVGTRRPGAAKKDGGGGAKPPAGKAKKR